MAELLCGLLLLVLAPGAGGAANGPCDAVAVARRAEGRTDGGAVGANGGFNLDMWATSVNRDGIVCGVAFTGGNRGDQWPGNP